MYPGLSEALGDRLGAQGLDGLEDMLMVVDAALLFTG